MVNFFQQWYDEMLAFKWKHVLQDHILFQNLSEIKKELELFFDTEDFITAAPLNPKNWLLHLLHDRQPGAISLMAELAELLRYLRISRTGESYRFRLKNGRMNYNGLEEKLFEVYICYLFYQTGLDPQVGRSYLSKEGNEKEIDLLVTIGQQTYIIEVTKYYDGFQDELLGLSKYIVRLMAELQKKKNIQRHEMLSGYIAFKTRNINAVRENKNAFQNRLNQFFHAFRSVKENNIKIKNKIVLEAYESDIESAFNEHHDLTYETILKPYLASIRFKTSYDVRTGMIQCQESVVYQPTTKEVQQRLEEKIREKLQQHRDSPYPLVIVIGIEQMFGSYDKSPAMAAQLDKIDEQAIHLLIHKKAVLMLLFRKLEPNGLVVHKKIFATSMQDMTLLKYLDKINPAVYYHNSQFLRFK